MGNRTIIVVTHEATLLNLADRVLSIREGRKDFDGSPDEYIRREYGQVPGLLQAAGSEQAASPEGSGFVEPEPKPRTQTASDQRAARFRHTEEHGRPAEQSHTSLDEDRQE